MSESSITVLATPGEKPLELAVTCTVSGPVGILLSMSVAVNVADADPAGIVTDDGNASSAVLPEASEITVVVANMPPIVTVPVSVWPFQPEAGKVTARVRSLSKMAIVAVPLTQLSIEAVTVTSIGS